MDHGAGLSPGLAVSFVRLLQDIRGVFLGLAFLATLSTFLVPEVTREQAVFTHVFIVDITRSMNVEDYELQGRGVSRLDFVKATLGRTLRDLPCGSRVGLGLFTERHATLLLEPIEVCSGFNELDQALERIDWRMAWATDSRIAKGLSSAMELIEGREANLVFLTDGHETPPVNPRYAQSFEGFMGKVKGMIVGVGGLSPAPIPKFDAEGRRVGFYTEEEVPHRSTFGLSHRKPSEIEGYNARNAPFGSEQGTGTEHLSSLRESYLKSIAAESGFFYHRLQTPAALSEALRAPALAERKPVQADIRGVPAALALVFLLCVYLVAPLLEK